VDVGDSDVKASEEAWWERWGGRKEEVSGFLSEIK
jgi:hypothetical protein